MHNHFYIQHKKEKSAINNVTVSTSSSFFDPVVQAKLSVNATGDACEQEADTVAEKVVQKNNVITPSTFFTPQIVHRKCAHCKEEEKQTQRKENKSNSKTSSSQTENYISSLSGGNPLNKNDKSFFESRLGYDFSDVRIHTNNEANQSAKNINALAYTHENNIVFDSDQYQPNTTEGKKLLAHELTHVVQQQNNISAKQIQTQRRPARRTPTDILNSDANTTRAYRTAVQHWPDADSIWDVLTSVNAKINFVRYILAFDQTNCVPYDATDTNAGESCSATASAVSRFTNACQGYASQLYSRYTSSGRLSASAETQLQSQANIVIGTVPAKLQIPIRIASIPGHAFNAVLVGSDESDVNSWIFFEPQNDHIFLATDPVFTSSMYASSGIFSLSSLTNYTAERGYEQRTERTFLLNSSSNQFTNATLTQTQLILLQNLLRDIFIADDPSSYPYYTNLHNPPQTYEQLIASYSTSDIHTLALAFNSVTGRLFRRTLRGASEIMTKPIYLQLLNNPFGLAALLP